MRTSCDEDFSLREREREGEREREKGSSRETCGREKRDMRREGADGEEVEEEMKTLLATEKFPSQERKRARERERERSSLFFN